MPQVQVQEVSPPSHNRAKISKEILQELQRPVSVGDLLMFGVMMFFLGIQWLFNKTRQGLAYLHTVGMFDLRFVLSTSHPPFISNSPYYSSPKRG